MKVFEFFFLLFTDEKIKPFLQIGGGRTWRYLVNITQFKFLWSQWLLISTYITRFFFEFSAEDDPWLALICTKKRSCNIREFLTKARLRKLECDSSRIIWEACDNCKYVVITKLSSVTCWNPIHSSLKQYFFHHTQLISDWEMRYYDWILSEILMNPANLMYIFSSDEMISSKRQIQFQNNKY